MTVKYYEIDLRELYQNLRINSNLGEKEIMKNSALLLEFHFIQRAEVHIKGKELEEEILENRNA